MRRKEKEILDRNVINFILRNAEICRIGLCDNNIPYVVPMNFAHEGDFIYLHCATEGKKIYIIKNNDNVCFEVDTDTEIVKAETPCGWGMKFQSVIGIGKASIVSESAEKKHALDVIMEKYSGQEGFEYPEAMLHRTAIIKIQIFEITGKRSL